MNGQPTAQNNRECGADGDLPGFRNWENPDHVAELAELWNVDRLTSSRTGRRRRTRCRSSATPSRARSSSCGSRRPTRRCRCPSSAGSANILAKPGLFLVVVQDLFLTETAQLADVVLPAAGWGEKTGTFTNANRTVHLSDKAVEPPGEARSDLDIFLDYARRMGFTTTTGTR